MYTVSSYSPAAQSKANAHSQLDTARPLTASQGARSWPALLHLAETGVSKTIAGVAEQSRANHAA
eukprot:11252451-Alexandrium_andersonii.AAC.1